MNYPIEVILGPEFVTGSMTMKVNLSYVICFINNRDFVIKLGIAGGKGKATFFNS